MTTISKWVRQEERKFEAAEGDINYRPSGY
jgi:hypothetical protein